MTRSLTTLDDSTLIKLALAGQVECFTALMNRHMPAVKRSIGSVVGNTADAEDVLQEVLLKVWRCLSSFRSESSFRTWITRVAINEALQSHRRLRTRPRCQPLIDPDAIPSSADSPHQCLTRIETTQAIRGALATLPAKYRQVLILRDLEELSSRDTAQLLQSNIPTVKTRLSRARLMLLASLQRTKGRGRARAA